MATTNNKPAQDQGMFVTEAERDAEMRAAEREWYNSRFGVEDGTLKLPLPEVALSLSSTHRSEGAADPA